MIASKVVPFEPIGDVARWRTLYEHIEGFEPGDLIALDEIRDLCHGTLDRSSLYRAVRELELNHRRTLDSVRGIGYRMVRAEEHVGIGNRHLKRSRKQVRKGLSKITSVRRSELSDDQKLQIDRLHTRLSHVEQAQRMQAEKIDRLESMTKSVSKKQQESDSSLEEVVAALRKHGMLEA